MPCQCPSASSMNIVFRSLVCWVIFGSDALAGNLLKVFVTWSEYFERSLRSVFKSLHLMEDLQDLRNGLVES